MDAKTASFAVPMNQQLADWPERMHPRLQRDPAARRGPEPGFEGLRRGGNLVLQNHASGFVQNAVIAGTIPQIQPNGQRVGLQFFDRLPSRNAKLLQAGLLYLLRFERVAITWERTASRRRPAFSSHLI